LFTVAGERIVTRLRRDLFSRIMIQDIAFFDGQRTGELINRLASDTAVLQNTVSVNISMALRFGALTLGGLVLLFYTSPRLTLVMMSVVPFLTVGVILFGRRIRKLSKRVQDVLARSSQIAEEAISGIRTVRAFSREAHEIARYTRAVFEAFALARRRSLATGILMGASSCAGYGAISLVLWYGGRLVATGTMSIGALTSFVLYMLIVAGSFGMLVGLWTDFMRATGAAEHVFRLIDQRPSIPLGEGETLPQVRGEVTFERVSFAYPSRPNVPVLEGVDLTLEAGRIVALVGPSGGGKSTIAALIPRFYDPDAGVIRLDGKDLKRLDATWLRQQIGIVAQEPVLFSTSIAENIAYGAPHATQAEIETAARTANAEAFIARLPEGYATLVGERGIQLSGGQRQRIAIARAILRNPRILILDEATSALDAESEFLVKEALDRVMRGRTTLVIAHRLSTVRDADLVVVVEGGEIVEQGTHTALLAAGGLYRRLIERQFVPAQGG
ncbi:MAG: ATP-binding cassette domain-containing protein, partial [Deltaproteobacteria bacterium]